MLIIRSHQSESHPVLTNIYFQQSVIHYIPAEYTMLTTTVMRMLRFAVSRGVRGRGQVVVGLGRGQGRVGSVSCRGRPGGLRLLLPG